MLDRDRRPSRGPRPPARPGSVATLAGEAAAAGADAPPAGAGVDRSASPRATGLRQSTAGQGTAGQGTARQGTAPAQGAARQGTALPTGRALRLAGALRSATTGRAGLALAPAAVYLAVRLVGVGVLALMAARNHSTLLGELASWDGEWLLGIAQHGYDGVPARLVDVHGERNPFSALGFFPGYPALVAAVAPVTGGSYVAAGLVVALVAGIVGAYGLARLGEIVPGGSRWAGLLLVGLFAAMPMGVTLSMTYSESLFCALAVWALVAVLRRWWALAGVLTAAAGLVRPTVVALIVAVGLAALAALLVRRDGIRPLLCGLMAPVGLLGYLAYVAARTGELDGWSRIQRDGWNTHVDGGAAVLDYVLRTLGGSQQIHDLLSVGALLASLVLFAVAVRMRLPWPLLVYAGVGLATVWGTDGVMNSKLRFLVPLFVLLMPVALGLANRRRATAVAVLVAAALVSAWVGGFALTVWRYGI